MISAESFWFFGLKNIYFLNKNPIKKSVFIIKFVATRTSKLDLSFESGGSYPSGYRCCLGPSRPSLRRLGGTLASADACSHAHRLCQSEHSVNLLTEGGLISIEKIARVVQHKISKLNKL